MSFPYYPLCGRVFIAPQQMDVSAGGIVIPDTVQLTLGYGTVLRASPLYGYLEDGGWVVKATPVSDGDTVLYDVLAPRSVVLPDGMAVRLIGIGDVKGLLLRDGAIGPIGDRLFIEQLPDTARSPLALPDTTNFRIGVVRAVDPLLAQAYHDGVSVCSEVYFDERFAAAIQFRSQVLHAIKYKYIKAVRYEA